MKQKIDKKNHPINALTFRDVSRIADENDVSWNTVYEILMQTIRMTTRAKDGSIIFYKRADKQ